MGNTAVYFHWPFCKSKCPYCDFVSLPSSDESLYAHFEDLMLSDLKNSLEYLFSSYREEGKNFCIGSVFFGGGTPSLMNPSAAEKILNFLFGNYPAESKVEVSLEANPATFDKKRMKDFKCAGINRLSLGVQSFFDKNLRFLGRIYDGKQAAEAAGIVSEVFENFSFDLMCGYECQNEVDLKADLKQAAEFGCKHLSCYQLTFEKNTPFHKKMLAGEIKTSETEFYDLIENVLKEYGIFRYEISNCARPGFESRHNLAYWRYEDYLGIGPSACSRVTVNGQKIEAKKISDPFLWANAVAENRNAFSLFNILTEEEKLQEAIITGLRLIEGISADELCAKVSPEVVHRIVSPQKLEFLRKKRLLAKEKIRLTRVGLKRMNAVLEFLLSEERRDRA
ncbi:MAG: radical SAM family heme chaperone HemW [Holosporaceae bacterium]|jgi:oxygen-independent coproporphyrinogen-3 oxidase|nr:radical SAM family heme chaperone HemW [Holosporaceae bacterium]